MCCPNIPYMSHFRNNSARKMTTVFYKQVFVITQNIINFFYCSFFPFQFKLSFIKSISFFSLKIFFMKPLFLDFESTQFSLSLLLCYLASGFRMLTLYDLRGKKRKSYVTHVYPNLSVACHRIQSLLHKMTLRINQFCLDLLLLFDVVYFYRQRLSLLLYK